MIKEQNPVSEDILEIEDTFLLLMNFTKNKILEDSIKNEITCGQFEILSLLNKNGRATIHEIVETQSLTYPACTLLIDGLAKLNLVTRSRSDTDRRSVYVFMTDSGKDLLNKIISKRHNILKQILELMDPREIKIIRESLVILKEKLNVLEVKK